MNKIYDYSPNFCLLKRSKKRIKLIKIELLNSIDLKNNNSNISEIISYLGSHNYFLDTIVKSKFDNNKLLMMDTYFKTL